MDKMLEDLESDIYSVESDGSTDLERNSQLVSKLPHHSSILLYNNRLEVVSSCLPFAYSVLVYKNCHDNGKPVSFQMQLNPL